MNTTQREVELEDALRDAIAFIEAGIPDDDSGEPDESITMSVDGGPDVTFLIGWAKSLLEGGEG